MHKVHDMQNPNKIQYSRTHVYSMTLSNSVLELFWQKLRTTNIFLDKKVPTGFYWNSLQSASSLNSLCFAHEYVTELGSTVTILPLPSFPFQVLSAWNPFRTFNNSLAFNERLLPHSGKPQRRDANHAGHVSVRLRWEAFSSHRRHNEASTGYLQS